MIDLEAIHAHIVELVTEVERLQGDLKEYIQLSVELESQNSYLKACIQRWRLHNYPGHHHKEGTHFNCEVCNIHWPCPTEVAKGWKE